jgi:hypothetical protein
MRARLAPLIRYLSNDTHRLRMLPFVHDKSDHVGTYISRGLGHQSYSLMSYPALGNALERTWSPRERAKMYALGMSGLTGAPSDLEGQGRAGVAEGRAPWWLEQGPEVT